MYSCHYTLYKDKSLQFEHDKEADYRRVVAKSDIKRGTLLLVEHGVTEPGKKPVHITNILRVDKEWYNSLYPRTKPWSEDLLKKVVSEEDMILLNQKVSKNCFDVTVESVSKAISLYNDTSCFNSSLEYNAGVISVTNELLCPDKETPYIVPYAEFIFVVAMKDIKEGEEICIFYNLEEYNLLDNYLEKQKQVLSDVRAVMEERSEYFKQVIREMMSEYLNSDVGLQVLKNQVYAFHGFYQGEEESIILASFDEILKTLFSTDSDGLKRFDQWVHNFLCAVLDQLGI